MSSEKLTILKLRFQCYLMLAVALGMHMNMNDNKRAGSLNLNIYTAAPKGLVSVKCTGVRSVARFLNVTGWTALYLRILLGKEKFGKVMAAFGCHISNPFDVDFDSSAWSRTIKVNIKWI